MDYLHGESHREEVSSEALAYEPIDGLSLCAFATPTAAPAADLPTILSCITKRPASLAPFDGAESAVPEQHIHEADGTDRLIAIIHVRIARISLGGSIPEGDAVTVKDPQGERGVSDHHVFPSLRLRREHPGDIVFTSREIDHGPLAQDETEREQSLRTDAIVVIPIACAFNAAGGAIPGPPQGGPLKCYVLRQPRRFIPVMASSFVGKSSPEGMW